MPRRPEPLLAPKAPVESGADVLARLARALRGLAAFEANAPLAVVDALDVLWHGCVAPLQQRNAHRRRGSDAATSIESRIADPATRVESLARALPCIVSGGEPLVLVVHDA